MRLWAKSVVIFNAICEHGKQSIRSLADRTGLSKSSVHRHLQAMDRRDRYPESSLWETPAGRAWLVRLVVATLFVFGLKRGVGAETLSEFFGRLRLDGHVGCSPSALRSMLHTLEPLLLDTAAAWEKEGIAHGEIRPVIGAVDETCLQRMKLSILLEAFHGDDFALVGLHGEHGARLDRCPVEEDGARAAVGRVATDVGAGLAAVLAQRVDERASRLDANAVQLSVDVQRQVFHLTGSSRNLAAFALALRTTARTRSRL